MKKNIYEPEKEEIPIGEAGRMITELAAIEYAVELIIERELSE